MWFFKFWLIYIPTQCSAHELHTYVYKEKLISLSNQTVMVTSLQLLQTCVDSSQSHRQPRTYFPGLILSGISTLSIISTWSFHSPEHLQVPGGGSVVWEFLHSSFSSHTGSKLVPYFIHALGARGIGFLRQLEPAGVVPSLVSQPKRIKVQIKWKKGKEKKNREQNIRKRKWITVSKRIRKKKS